MNERLKELRKSLSLTMEQFGDKIGLSKSGISSIENGSRNVTPKHIKIICNEFNVNEEWLRTGEGNMYKDTDRLMQMVYEVGTNPDSQKSMIFRAISQMSDKDVEVLFEFARLLLKEQQEESKGKQN